MYASGSWLPLLLDNFSFETASERELGKLAKLRRRFEARSLQHLDYAIVLLVETRELVGKSFQQITENHFTDRETSVRQDILEAEFIAAKLFLHDANYRGQRGGREF